MLSPAAAFTSFNYVCFSAPKVIVSDNGAELTGNAILAFAAARGIGRSALPSDKPMQNGFVESFNGPIRAQPKGLRFRLGKSSGAGQQGKIPPELCLLSPIFDPPFPNYSGGPIH